MRQGIRDNQVTLKHVQTQHKGGKVYRYLRVPGKPAVRLPDLPTDHPDFLAAYIAGMGETPTRAAAGTIAALAEAFLRTKKFRDLSPDYRRAIRLHVDAIRTKAGAAKLAHLKPHHIAADIAGLDVHAARKRRKAWRLLCAHGLAAGLLTADPSEGTKAPTAPKTDGYEAWTLAEIDAYRAKWQIGTMQRRAFEVLFWTGSRISDAVALGPGMVARDGVLTYRQSKTGDPAFVPWSCALPRYAAPLLGDRDMMHAALVGPLTMTFLETTHGRARSRKSLGNFIGESARAAGVAKSAHGLRKSRAVALAEAGGTAHEIASWTGHHTLAEVAHYTAAADRRRAVMGTDQGHAVIYSPERAV